MSRKSILRVSLFLTLALSVLAACAALGAHAADQPAYTVTVLTDRPPALYHVGETTTFTIAVTAGETPIREGEATYVLSDDGTDLSTKRTISLAQNPVTVKGGLGYPGFLRCEVTYAAPDGKTYTGIAGAGFDPQDIKPSMPVPDDFDAFWTEKRKQLAEVPMEPVLTQVEQRVDSVDCFDVQIPCLGGKPVSGYYMRPVNAQPKTLPAVLWVHGAGVGSSSRRDEVAALGMLVLDINAHGIPNGKPREFYQELNDTTLKNYRFEGRESRETYYFLGMYLRLMRAMDFLTAQPEWDGEILIARGSSQGGGQALVAAGLDPRVTALIANVPAMCDHTAAINGWPRLVPRDADGNPDLEVFETARYFDAMNFATRTKADALVSVGFIDKTCRPTSVYAAYNNLPGKKAILIEPRMPHAFPPDWNEIALKFMHQHITAARPVVTQ